MPRITLKTKAQISEEIECLNSTTSKLDLMGLYTTTHAMIKELIFFSSIQEIVGEMLEISIIQTLEEHGKNRENNVLLSCELA